MHVLYVAQLQQAFYDLCKFSFNIVNDLQKKKPVLRYFRISFVTFTLFIEYTTRDKIQGGVYV